VQQEVTLTSQQEQTLKEWMHNLVDKKEPIQYLLGSVPFNGVTILVRPPILIPRPETEEWCVHLIEQLKPLAHHAFTILDLCCGSGCLAIAFAKALPKATIYALDINPAALELTRENANYNSAANVITLQSDLFQALPDGIQFDLIVSNPPYISPQEWETLDDSVKLWESEQALLAQDHGLAVIKNIVARAPEYLRSSTMFPRLNIPQLMVEIGYNQGKMVANIFKQAGYSNITTHKDAQGLDRTVSGSL
jgi:release factor glutamine methyltransferase